ncbi:hypothetical protein SeMB42_g01460 [Synchytrium endobioticum]|uniref:K Homology domain-containing protein n=1 Tax=Synchytrium endobioticum TaxID=286115 RepID=A0A507DLJ6_9FUNG|nr:hypothetical protein SeMB42_g01460 [Synchytrium endobioticum]
MEDNAHLAVGGSSSFNQLMNDLQFGTTTELQLQNTHSSALPEDAPLSPSSSKGRQPVDASTNDPPSAPPPITTKNDAKKNIDLTNEELFPSLPKSNVTNAPKWVPPKPTLPSALHLSGKVNGKRALPQEKFEVAADLVATGRRATPGDVVKATTAKYPGVNIDVATKKGALVFIVTGKADVLPLVRREILSAVCTQVTQTLIVPPDIRGFVIGKGGANLHALVTRTMTKITIPRQAGTEGASEEQLQDDDDQPVIIVGDPEGVELAKKEINDIVSDRTSKHVEKVYIDRVYQPFVAGPSNSNFDNLQTEFGVRIHMAPILAHEKSGEREAVKQVEDKLKAIYEDAKKRVKTSQLQVSKKQHRFVIGMRGSGLQEIFRDTACAVEVPPASDPSDMITVRGVEDNIGRAVQAVYARANSTLIEEVDVPSLIPKSTDPHHLVRHIAMKHKETIQELETAHSASIISLISPSNTPMFEIHAKTRADTDAARNGVKKLVQELGKELIFVPTTIPRELHKFVVGKGGANIQKLRNSAQYGAVVADVNVSSEEKESDDVIIAVKRDVNSKVADADAHAIANKVKEDLLAQATALADLTTEVMDVDNKYHGRIIGVGGVALKTLLEPYGDRVTIRFPDSKSEDSSINKNAIILRGAKADIAKVVESLESMIKEWKRMEALCSFNESITVLHGSASKIVGRSGSNMGWLLKALREKLATASEKDRKSLQEAGAFATGHLGIRIETSESVKGDIITIFGPKVMVALAKKLILERETTISNTITISLHVFDSLSPEAQSTMSSQSDVMEFKKSVMNRLVGQSRRNLKKVEDRHGVSITIIRRRQHRTAELADGSETNNATEENSSEAGLVCCTEDFADDGFTDGIFEIKGLKKDVEGARKRMVELTNHEVLNSYSKTFYIPLAALPHVVGKGGARITALRTEHHVQIDIVDDSTISPPSSRVTIDGAVDNVEAAQAKILETVDDTVHVETVYYPLPAHLHKHVIGPAGQRIRQIVETAGGQEKAKVQFPKVGVAERANEVMLKGSHSTLEVLKAEIDKVVQEIVGHTINDSDSSEVNGSIGSFTPTTTISGESIEHVFSVPATEASRIVGKNGETARSIMKNHNVIVFVNDADSSGTEDPLALVKIVGKRDSDIEAAKAEVISKLRTTVGLSVPPSIVKAFQTGGVARDVNVLVLQELGRKLKADLDVVLELPSDCKLNEGDLLVRGGDNLQTALKEVQKHLDELGDHAAYIPIEQSLRGHIIGREGRNLQRIRNEFGAAIDILKVQGRNVVHIRGSAEAVDAARQMVDVIVKDQERRSAVSAAPRPVPSSTPQALARIDDDDTNSVGTSSVAEGGSAVPGWSGRRNQLHPGRRQHPLNDSGSSSTPGLSTPASSAAILSADALASPRREEDAWQDVRSRRKKGETPGVSSPSPPQPQSALPPVESVDSNSIKSFVSSPQPLSSNDDDGNSKQKRQREKKPKQQQQQQQQWSSVPGAPPVLTSSITSIGSGTSTTNTVTSTTTVSQREPPSPEPQSIEEEPWTTVRKFKDKRLTAPSPTSVTVSSSASRPATPTTDLNSSSPDNESPAGDKKKKKKKKKSGVKKGTDGTE